MTKPAETKQAVPSPEDRVRAIREREQKATKGPWLVKRGHASADRCDGIEAHIGHTHPPEQSCWDVDECPGQAAEKIVETDSGFYGPCADDADFIAHARADIPYLLSLVEELKGQVAAKEPTPEQIKAIKVGIIKKWQSWIGPLGNPDHYKIQAKMLELEVARETAEAELDLLRKRKDYHAEYVEAVEAAEEKK